MKVIRVRALKRLAWGIFTLWVVSVVIFLGIELLPGDAAEAILGRNATDAAVATLRHELRLDLPFYLRYFGWLAGLLHGDLGHSLASGRAVSELIGGRLENTLFLAVAASLLSIPVALVLGTLAAIYRNSAFDRLITLVVIGLVAAPEFLFGYALILVFSIKLGVLPSLSDIGPETPFSERLYQIALPAMTLTLLVIAYVTRMTRASLVDILGRPFVEMATLKGIARWRIVVQHALPNAWAPIINAITLSMAHLIVGVVVVEVLFVYPGLGQLLVNSVAKRDVPVVQACSLIFAATYILLNALADILSIWANPRLLHAE